MFFETKSAISFSSMSLFIVLLRDFFIGREVEGVGRHDLGISVSPNSVLDLNEPQQPLQPSSELNICGGIAGTLNPPFVIKGDSLAQCLSQAPMCSVTDSMESLFGRLFTQANRTCGSFGKE